MSELNGALFPLTFGLKALPRNQSVALREMPMKGCRSKKRREFLKFDFAFQILVVNLSNPRPGE